MGKVVVLSEYRQRVAAEGGIDIDTGNGVMFHVDPPALWPDEFMAAARDNDVRRLAAIIIGGPEAYSAWCEHGGTAAVLLGILREELGLDLGE